MNSTENPMEHNPFQAAEYVVPKALENETDFDC